MKTRLTFILPAFAAMFLALPARAGTMSASASPPTIDGFDIANYGAVTGNEKWWAENSTGAGSAKGQTFTTGPAAVELRSISYQVTATQQAQPTKTYVVRVGSVAGTAFTLVHSETFTQSISWNSGEYMTWTFATPPLLLGNTTYAVDIGMTGSTSAWQTGIPYINVTANAYPSGQRYSSGQNGVGNGVINPVSTSDRIFHLDLGTPAGAGFELVAGNPPDDATDALIPPQLIATFNKNLVPGTGNVVIRNLTNSIDTPVAIGDPRITISDNLLLINTLGLIEWNKSYAIRMDAGSLNSDTGNVFSGIADDVTWNFTTAVGDPFLEAIADLKDHINGTALLSGPEIATRKQTIDAAKQRFAESAATITAVFDLVATYDAAVGPLFVAGSPVQSFDRNNAASVSDENIAWVIYTVMQDIMDMVYNAPAIASHEGLLNGYKFGSSAHFPGAVAPPADPDNTHTATINASFPDTFGRDTQQWTLPARKPTGTYLAPGSIATVTVPAALVGQGYQVRVGAHSWDMSGRPPVKRLERATILYSLDAATIKIASPYGGGIYIEVPKGANAGIQNVTITGAVRSPFFSAKSFHSTTASEWNTIERNHPAPWADFQTDKFMMQVSTNWIYALDGTDAVKLMADWDAAMDAINDLMGFPRIRGKETMYIQTDLIFRSSVHAPGYPATNVNFNPNSNAGGYANNYFVRGPQSGASTEFHEQGHAYFFPKFGGETESNVNLLYVPVRNVALGATLDDAFRTSVSYGNFGNVTNAPLDNTAVLWMTSFNFAPRKQPMGDWEKAYQPQGHAKFVDVARLFGWNGLNAYWYSMNLDEENGDPVPGSTDEKLLRLCKSVGRDIRPLFHFWGIHPENPATLAAAVQAEGLTPSPEIRNLLLQYKALVPVDHAAYQAWCLYWYGKAPSIGGNGVEREHARQWDTTSYWQSNGWDYSGTDPAQADGEIYTPESGVRIVNRVQEIIDLYFDDYDAWASGYPAAALSDPNADYDGDGLTNREERIWGLDPTSSSSVAPIKIPLNPVAGTFSYTRRARSLTGVDYKVWTSPDLKTWAEDPSAIQNPGTPVAEVETVSVTLSPALLTSPRLFVQIRASE